MSLWLYLTNIASPELNVYHILLYVHCSTSARPSLTFQSHLSFTETTTTQWPERVNKHSLERKKKHRRGHKTSQWKRGKIKHLSTSFSLGISKCSCDKSKWEAGCAHQQSDRKYMWAYVVVSRWLQNPPSGMRERRLVKTERR